MTDSEKALIERIEAHCEEHAKSGRAQFTVSAIQDLCQLARNPQRMLGPDFRGRVQHVSDQFSTQPTKVQTIDGEELELVLGCERDGFLGTKIGEYVTREGIPGVVLQQLGTKVVHVYRKSSIV